MEIYLFAAMSVDGFIATLNGSEDFLADEHRDQFKGLAEKSGCLIVGRKAYDEVQKWEEYGFDDIEAVKIVVSRNRELKLKQGYIWADSPEQALTIARGNKCEAAVIAGGAHLNSAFLDKDLIDELVLTIEPCAIGKGISFFADKKWAKRLQLIECNKLKEGIVSLHYKIIK
jgi:dihydrofolate reductase